MGCPNPWRRSITRFGLGRARGYYLDRDLDPLSTGFDLLPLDFGFTLDFFFPMCA